jgi:nucleoside-diphosphate-sugar epimerase
MQIAILGATSQIAKDLIISFTAQTGHELVLFARRPEIARLWLSSVGLKNRYKVSKFEAFSEDNHYDAILNLVGVGNPVQALAAGSSIFETTLKHDEMALKYQIKHPACRYVFFSSGAAYGSKFDQPVDSTSTSAISINNLTPQDWYAVSKLHAESRHRAMAHLPIVDVRVFNYVSWTQDISARFFITDILRSIKKDEKLYISKENIVRDYIGPDDLFNLILSIINSSATNDVVDCYTLAPVDKFTLLITMKKKFGLTYDIDGSSASVNATGTKLNYFSKNYRAESFGYVPSKNSLDTVCEQVSLAMRDFDTSCR